VQGLRHRFAVDLAGLFNGGLQDVHAGVALDAVVIRNAA